MKPKILAIIPARGGSKGVPRKNIREVAGKPLIAWTIEEAKKSKYITKTILSSEDEEIIHIAREYDCDVPFIRPMELAADEASGMVPVLHAISELKDEKFDYIVLLQPTSPLRTVEDIDGCIKLALKTKNGSVVSVTDPNKSPYWMYKLDENKNIQPIFETESKTLRRQELPKVYTLNGAVYVSTLNQIMQVESFITRDTKGYIMPQERSYDIDNEIDFTICDFLIRKRV